MLIYHQRKLYYSTILETLYFVTNLVPVADWPFVWISLPPGEHIPDGVCIPDPNAEPVADGLLEPLLEMTLEDPLECDATSKFSVWSLIASSALVGTVKLLQVRIKLVICLHPYIYILISMQYYNLLSQLT